jgi:hypothetical protein
VGVSIPFRIKQHKVHRCREGEREWNGEVLPTISLRGGGVHHGVGVGGEKRCSGAAGGASHRWWCYPWDPTRVGMVAARANLVT